MRSTSFDMGTGTEQTRLARGIVKALDPIMHTHADQAFRDFCHLSAVNFKHLPDVLEAARRSHREREPFIDPTSDHPVFVDLRRRYSRDDFHAFARATSYLMTQADAGYMDPLGEAYEELSSRYKASALGQFFTPMPLVHLMAAMTAPDTDLDQRLVAAGANGDVVRSLLAMDGASRDAHHQFLMQVLPRLDVAKYEPARVYDCCVGSGRCLLGAAAGIPRWAVQWGLVQFYGQDIDPVCVAMCETNVSLYGMNGLGARCLLASGKLNDYALIWELWEPMLSLLDTVGATVEASREVAGTLPVVAPPKVEPDPIRTTSGTPTDPPAVDRRGQLTLF